jgi:hypothetical protein
MSVFCVLCEDAAEALVDQNLREFGQHIPYPPRLPRTFARNGAYEREDATTAIVRSTSDPVVEVSHVGLSKVGLVLRLANVDAAGMQNWVTVFVDYRFPHQSLRRQISPPLHCCSALEAGEPGQSLIVDAATLLRQELFAEPRAHVGARALLHAMPHQVVFDQRAVEDGHGVVKAGDAAR